jgi:hypothetical protein
MTRIIVLGLDPFLAGRALDANGPAVLFSLLGIIPRLFISVSILISLFAD